MVVVLNGNAPKRMVRFDGGRTEHFCRMLIHDDSNRLFFLKELRREMDDVMLNAVERVVFFGHMKWSRLLERMAVACDFELEAREDSKCVDPIDTHYKPMKHRSYIVFVKEVLDFLVTWVSRDDMTNYRFCELRMFKRLLRHFDELLFDIDPITRHMESSIPQFCRLINIVMVAGEAGHFYDFAHQADMRKILKFLGSLLRSCCLNDHVGFASVGECIGSLVFDSEIQAGLAEHCFRESFDEVWESFDFKRNSESVYKNSSNTDLQIDNMVSQVTDFKSEIQLLMRISTAFKEVDRGEWAEEVGVVNSAVDRAAADDTESDTDDNESTKVKNEDETDGDTDGKRKASSPDETFEATDRYGRFIHAVTPEKKKRRYFLRTSGILGGNDDGSADV